MKTGPKPMDLSGQTFGRLLVVSRAASDGYHARWLCKCVCGTKKVVRQGALRSSDAVSCGCFHHEQQRKMMTTHGKAKCREYRIWAGMLNRCVNPKSPRFNRYGGRGIAVCDRWQTFAHFWADMGKSPHQTTIERIDNNDGYNPGNCRWATRLEQAQNTSLTRMVEWRGAHKSIREWSDITGLSLEAIRSRIKKGWGVERALTEPVATKYHPKAVAA